MSPHPVESLSALLDGELEDAERRGVEAHLAACPACARHLRELAAVDGLARGLPPAGAPDGYLETLPGRVRRRIRADRPASRRATWVWPLAAGLALAVLAPIVLRQQLARERRSPGSPAVGMEAPAPPPTTLVQEEHLPAAARPSVAMHDERRRVDSGVAHGEGTVAPPLAPPPAPRREAAPEAKTRDTFVAPPPADRAKESDRAAATANDAIAGAAISAPPAGAAAQEQVTVERSDAPSSLKKAEAAPLSAAGALRENSSLPASTAEEARTAREAWRRFVAGHPAGPQADEGRVRFIEAAVTVFRLTGAEDDRALAERHGRAYLSSPVAPQAERVKAALRRLDEPR